MADPREGSPTSEHDRLNESLLKLFAPGEDSLTAEKELDTRISAIVQEFLCVTQSRCPSR